MSSKTLPCWVSAPILTWSSLYRQPVLGLVFLFKYAPDLEDDSDGDDKDGKDLDGVWFANQVSVQNILTSSV